MARANLSTEAVVDLAVGLIDAGGPEDLTLAKVAGAAGVSSPSLYKHVANLVELRSLVSARVAGELAEAVRTAAVGRAGEDAIRACMHAWRDYARAHPRRYAALIQRPEPRTGKAAQSLLESVFAVLRGLDLAEDELVHATRCVRAAVHGFAVLESGGGFGLPEDIDESFARMVEMVVAGVRARA
ncbi:transcriptional regulator, TetR family [Glycomyces sambucus]|uniref:Transcriptional regulator, TetR family n=1 Tax=Glycomyces sambucus TaxID=380244 RepID=A0A1G9FYA8_9ACTN|nr:TetR/AcrR family transcriptional regulator [Glycomyces sambucus]SDK93431.1 transcriptional regulator, TetR family [Glycomyces sambucus]